MRVKRGEDLRNRYEYYKGTLQVNNLLLKIEKSSKNTKHQSNYMKNGESFRRIEKNRSRNEKHLQNKA